MNFGQYVHFCSVRKNIYTTFVASGFFSPSILYSVELFVRVTLCWVILFLCRVLPSKQTACVAIQFGVMNSEEVILVTHPKKWNLSVRGLFYYLNTAPNRVIFGRIQYVLLFQIKNSKNLPKAKDYSIFIKLTFLWVVIISFFIHTVFHLKMSRPSTTTNVLFYSARYYDNLLNIQCFHDIRNANMLLHTTVRNITNNGPLLWVSYSQTQNQ